MAFLKAAILLHLLNLTLSQNFVSADESLIERECQNAKVPSTCIQCLKSDPVAEHADTKGIATILMNCVSNQADTLAGNMSDMAATEKDHSVKTVCQQCKNNYASAKQDIISAKVALMNNNFGESVKCLVQAVKCDFACHEAIIMFITRMPKQKTEGIFQTMSVYNDLSEAASSIIGRL